MKNGLKLKSRSFKDWSWEKIVGKQPPAAWQPFEHDISGIPVVYQGTSPTCVPSAITWLKQYLEINHPDLAVDFLAKIAETDANGTVLGEALEAARKAGICTEVAWTQGDTQQQTADALEHKLPAYAYVLGGDDSTYNALKGKPLLITLKDYNGSGPHCMVLTGVVKLDGDEEQLYWKGVNWDSADQQGQFFLPVGNTKFVDVVNIIPKPENTTQLAMSFLSVLYSKAQTIVSKLTKKGIAGIVGALMLAGGLAGQQFGNAGVATSYATVIAGSGINSSAVYIPVASRTLYTGELITTSTTQFPAYFVINQGGSTQETVECWGLVTTTTNPTWGPCVRGLSALGGATSTVSGAAKAHAPGERFIMSNVGPFYNRFVDIYTDQDIGGHKDFTNVTTTFGGDTGGIVWFPDTSQLGYTNDGISSFTFDAGSSGLTASSSKGIFVTASQIGIKLSTSSTNLLTFDLSGGLLMNASSSAFLAAQAPAGYYGDGSNGASTTQTGTTTLQGDQYFTSFTVSTGTTLITNGYRIFATTGITNNGIIQNNGTNGGNGGDGGAAGTNSASGTAGTLGIGAAGGSLRKGADGSPGSVGGQGGTCNAGNGFAAVAGVAGSSTIHSIGVSGQSGAAGGAGGASGVSTGGSSGSAGSAGTATAASLLPRDYGTYITGISLISTTTQYYLSAGSGSGGGGGGGGCQSGAAAGTGGGGGGGSGGQGGWLALYSPTITNNYIIRAIGGNGGNGGNSQAPTNGGGGCGGAGGGGGAGSGGQGGVLFLLTKNFVNNGSTSVAGGSPGTGGTTFGSSCIGGPAPANGSSGTTGTTGVIYQVN